MQTGENILNTGLRMMMLQPFRFNEIRRVGRLIRIYEHKIERFWIWVECAD